MASTVVPPHVVDRESLVPGFLTKHYFAVQKILPAQGLLEGKENWSKILRFFGDEEFVHRLSQRWSQQTAELGSNINITRWNEIEIEIAKLAKVSSILDLLDHSCINLLVWQHALMLSILFSPYAIILQACQKLVPYYLWTSRKIAGIHSFLYMYIISHYLEHKLRLNRMASIQVKHTNVWHIFRKSGQRGLCDLFCSIQKQSQNPQLILLLQWVWKLMFCVEQEWCQKTSACPESSERDTAGVCLPKIGCWGLQEDESSSQSTLLRSPEDWQGGPQIKFITWGLKHLFVFTKALTGRSFDKRSQLIVNWVLIQNPGQILWLWLTGVVAIAWSSVAVWTLLQVPKYVQYFLSCVR